LPNAARKDSQKGKNPAREQGSTGFFGRRGGGKGVDKKNTKHGKRRRRTPI